MIEIKNKQITEPTIDILYDLRRELMSKGKNRLADIIDKGTSAVVTCPKHKGGCEDHPSCYINLIDTDKFKEGSVHCFTCGYNANIQQFIADCFDVEDISFGENWILEHCKYSYLTTRRTLNKIKSMEIVDKKQELVSEEELKSYRFYHPYMFQRKLTKEIINKFDIGFDKNSNSITFPVYNNNGGCEFVVKRNVDYKRFSIPKGIKKQIFGINQIPKSCNEVIICESVFNALTCWVYGKVGVALFGTGSEEQIEQLKKLNVRKYILAFDGDSAGRNATLKFKKALGGTKIIQIYQLPDGKDINDLSKEEFDKLESKKD